MGFDRVFTFTSIVAAVVFERGVRARSARTDPLNIIITHSLLHTQELRISSYYSLLSLNVTKSNINARKQVLSRVTTKMKIDSCSVWYCSEKLA